MKSLPEIAVGDASGASDVSDNDRRFMGLALRLAERAGREGEVPVGALVARGGEILGRGYNRPIGSGDPTAHAEMAALRNAARRAGNYRLTGATLYVTLEPCLMCAGALLHARIRRVVVGARDPKVGALDLLRDLARKHAVNHRLEAVAGVRGEECGALLRKTFRRLRRKN